MAGENAGSEKLLHGRPWFVYGVLSSTLVALVLILGRYSTRHYGPPVFSELLGLGAVLCLGIPPVIVALTVYRTRPILVSATLVMLLIVLSQIFRAFLELDAPDYVPFVNWLNTEVMSVHFLLDLMLHFGLALLVLTFYLCLIEGDRYRRALAAQGATLQEERDRVRQYLDMAGELICCLDLEGRLILLNRQGYDLLGHPAGSLAGKVLLDIAFPPSDRDAIRARFAEVASGQRELTGRFEQAVVTASGEQRMISWQNQMVFDRVGRMTGMLLSGTDITEQRQKEEARRIAEQRAQQAQRLESLGVLAGGIAHEFNNLLMSVLGNIELAMLDIPSDSVAAQRLAAVEAAAQRAARLTQEMLDYSGHGPQLVEPIDLSVMIRDMAGLIKAAVGDRISLQLALAEGLPMVEGDSSQLREVVMNLVTNGAEAMAGQGGRLTIRTVAVDMTAQALAALAPQDALRGGRYIALEVKDEGIGMDAETLARAFDPFFTTQFTGRGLGLAAVLGIVRSHHGAIDPASTPGDGTTLRVLLPALVSSASKASAQPAEVPVWKDWRAVLLVDDDPAVLEVGREYLEMQDIPVLTATSGNEALKVLAQSQEHVACVVLDHQMPGMASRETLDHMHALRPGLPVLLSSGYGRDDLASQMDFTGFAGFLQKPYRSGELAEVLRELLEPAEPPEAPDSSTT